MSRLVRKLRRAWTALADPGPDADDMDDGLHKARKRRQVASDATRRAEDSLSRVRLIIETAGAAADMVERWRR
jgi:hypothetical protein